MAAVPVGHPTGAQFCAVEEASIQPTGCGNGGSEHVRLVVPCRPAADGAQGEQTCPGKPYWDSYGTDVMMVASASRAVTHLQG
jgi:hypothetical protein